MAEEAFPDLRGLPGAERIECGVRDLNCGRASIDGLLVAAAAGRMRGLGLPVAEGASLGPEPELALYAALQDSGEADPYYRYNSLRREMDSFVSALEARLARSPSGG